MTAGDEATSLPPVPDQVTGDAVEEFQVESSEPPRGQLRTEGLVKAYKGRRVVDGVSITINAGEIVGLLGTNGAGKTTTFYMVVGLVRPEQGRVLLDHQDITTLPMHLRARRGLGYLAQQESIFRRMTVEENLRSILELRDISPEAREQQLEWLLDELHIADRRHQLATTLSGGERRRAEIARAMATEPRFLLLDEPFTGVDPLHVSEIRDIVQDLRQRIGIGVLLTDHNPQATLKLCDRAYLMAEGQILLEGTSAQIARDPVAREKYLGKDFEL